jgi:hypothetical protein
VSRISVIVLAKDGEAIAGIWNNTAVAALRFPLS